MLAVLAVVVGAGIAIGVTVGHDGWGGPWRGDGPGPGGPDRGPPAAFPFVVVVAGAVAVGATARAYRRVAVPAGELLEAAGEVGAGRYDRRLEPRGPKDLRALMHTFNEMTGQLDAAEQRRRQFVADVTHELRTPLSVLQSGIEAQLDGIHPRDDAHLASLLEETRLLTRVVDDLHTLALAGAGRLTLHRETVDPASLVDDAVVAAAAAATRRGVHLTGDVAAGTPALDADPVRLRQVLGNLLANAVRHTPAGGRVTVAAGPSEGGEAVRFTVTDTGPGLPPDQLPGLFDRFTKSADSGGSGLGLAIARDLVTAHGGDIEAGNREGGGAAVSFRIPVGRS